MQKFAILDEADAGEEEGVVESFGGHMADERAKDKGRQHYLKGKEKELRVKFNSNTGLYYIGFEGGGQVPKALSGSYTSRKVALKIIADYTKGH